MNNFQSLATIKAPEFINLEPLDINPFMLKCDIKVLYLGENRNRTYISKEVAAEMAKTLRGTPIVGYFKQEKSDFRDHGEKVTLDADGISFETKTKPFGFVSPDSKVWFQEFEDTDATGNKVIRTYLMTQGYLWKEQFKEEVDCLVEAGGKPQSMEIDQESMEGYWSFINNSNYEFFIIDDAIFSKLCILGDDIEPCFEGSSIVPTTHFSLDKEMRTTLYSMMKDLQNIIKGGSTSVDEQNIMIEQPVEVVPSEEAPAAEFEAEAASESTEAASESTVAETASVDTEVAATQEENISNVQDNSVESVAENNEVTIEENVSSEYVKEEEEKESDSTDGEDGEDKEEEDAKKKYTALEAQYNELSDKYQALETEVKALREYKAAAEDKAKDELIGQFYMLSDEDKKDVVANKSQYTLDEIKSKLAVICFDKKINYSLNEEDNQETPVDRYTVNVAQVDSSIPAWLEAVDNHIENQQ